MEFSHWLAFFAACWAISISPGAGAVAAMSAGLNYGFARGYFTVFGLILGIWTQLVVVAVGLGALVAASGTAFLVIKWAGVAYLVWLGIGLLRSSAEPAAGPGLDGGPQLPSRLLGRLFVQGFLTNALNPKVALFFLAFVPQFIHPQAARPAWAFVLLGSVFVANSTMVNLLIAAAAAALPRRLAGQTRWQRLGPWLNRGAGGLFVALGLKLALGATGR